MTYRDDIRAWVAENGSTEALAGFEDVSPETFSSALLHFADSASLPEADALAPFVTRVSPVPFESGDLAPFPEADALLESGGDAYTLLNEIGLAEPSATDPEVVSVLERIDGADTSDRAGDDEEESTFGIGDDDEPVDEVEDLEEALEVLEETGDGLFEEVLEAAEDGLGVDIDGIDTATFTDLFDQASNAAGIEDLDASTDPADLDFE